MNSSHTSQYGTDSDGERCSLAPTISTNATADSIDGPGRTLYKLYDFAGRKLEDGLNPLLRKLRKDKTHNDAHHRSPRHGIHSNDVEYDSDLECRLEVCSLASSISSTATADNLPGGGHTLGLFYAAAGKKLERKLGKWSEKAGRGPNVIALRIRRRRMKALQLPPGSRKSLQKGEKVRKDCRKLLGYVQSPTPLTQVQALDHIINLVIGDPFIREQLRLMKAELTIKPLLFWNAYKGDLAPRLQSRSRKAPICLADTTVNALAHTTEARTFEGSIWPEGALANLAELLKDADRAFLVVRHIKRILDKLILEGHIYVSDIVHSTMDFRKLPQDGIEWSCLDSLILQLLTDLTMKRNWGMFDLASLLVFILRNADRLPETVASDVFQWFQNFDTSEEAFDTLHIYFTNCLVRGIAHANCLGESPISCLDLAYLQKLYPSTLLEPLLRRISCPPEVILANFISNSSNFQEMAFFERRTYSFMSNTVVLDIEYLKSVCSTLALCVDSDKVLVRVRALRAFKYVIGHDNYCREAALRTLSMTRFASSAPFIPLVKGFEGKCVPGERLWGDDELVVRHCDNNGSLLHLHQQKWTWYKGRSSECNICDGFEQVLRFQFKDVLQLKIPRGKSFVASGHNPLSAGITISGRRTYIAKAMARNDTSRGYIAIPEGTKPEDLRVKDEETGKELTPMFLLVYVLRYPPSAYTRCKRLMGYLCEGDIGPDATGPYSWQPWGPDDQKPF